MNQHSYLHIHKLAGNMALQKTQEEKSKEDTKNELAEAVGNSEEVLVRAQTVFPLTLFPSTVSVDRTKIAITERNFLKSGEAISIRIEDVLNVTAAVGPFFGSISIASRFFNPEPYKVEHLKRSDALRIKRILQGYLLARQQEIDCSALSATELAKTLDELGQVPNEERV
jgi:hypothetical protein